MGDRSGSPYACRMRVELPEGYVPPQPTHPMYGYLTPQEQEAFEAEERARLGIVPGVAAVSEAPEGHGGRRGAGDGVVGAAGLSARCPRSRRRPGRRSSAEPDEAAEATVGRTGWIPAPPPDPAVEPVTVDPAALGAVGEYRWDAYRQEWVPAATGTPAAPVVAEEPPPDVAAAAGGRGASSSWTSGDGSRFRWDARAQRWITEPAGARPASGLARARAMEHTGPRARVAEWQTRWLQVPVPERAWGFKSPLAHRRTSSVNAVDNTPSQGCDPPRCASRAGYPMRRARWTVRPLSSSRSSRTAANAVMWRRLPMGVQVLRRLPVLVEVERGRVLDSLGAGRS